MPASATSVADMQLPQERATFRTRRTSTGACFREVVPTERQECPESSAWLASWLSENGYKAYTADTNVLDPKQRREGNLLSNWCGGDASLKLWDPKALRPVASSTAPHAFEQSSPGI